MKYLKALPLFVAALLFFQVAGTAQKFAYVDVQEILENIAEYQEAQAELDRLANQWRQEIAQEYDVIKGMYNRYQAEQVLLSEDARKQREDEIMNKEKAVREMQRDRFGPEGALFKRRQELVQPIQERVYAAIESYAQERSYDFIFDRSSDSGMIFSNPQYDKTEDIIRRL
ncbi:MAG: OmpH family outer membrane protein [Saprospiraceae bacterium]